jgi:glutamyl-tRNA reductase
MSSTRRDLDRIHVRFATFRDRSADERSRRAMRLGRLPTDERVMLETCHRVELVSVDDGPSDGPMATGADAVRRVLEVVAGFDSAVIAEEQLLGQARGAYEAALAAGRSGPILNELFRRALRFGRRVRSHARPGADRSLADRGAAWLLDDRTGVGDRVLVAGTGEMGRLAAGRLASAGRAVTIVSRSPERGGRLLELLPGWGHRLVVGPLPREAVAACAALVLAVRARQPVLTAAHLDGPTHPWTVDLSTPAAVADDVAAQLGERLLGLDRLGEIEGSAPVLAPDVERRLRRELDGEVGRFVAWLDTRASGDALALLHGEADAVRRRHLDRLRRRAGLAPDQLAAVEAASAAMLGELLHGPSVELRRGGADAATVRRLFGLEP